MPKFLHFGVNVPRITQADLSRFSDTADIRDPVAFADALQALVEERYGKAVSSAPVPETAKESAEQVLARKAAALVAPVRWSPGETEIQRGRAALLEAFEQPHNLPLSEFARLANKSRQQIYKDIEAGRLLALNVGPRGQRLPDWQLDSVKQRLTQSVLGRAGKVDTWTMYTALSEPLEGLGGVSPVESVTAASLEDVTRAVLNVLGLH